jgi:hypothetical protein
MHKTKRILIIEGVVGLFNSWCEEIERINKLPPEIHLAVNTEVARKNFEPGCCDQFDLIVAGHHSPDDKKIVLDFLREIAPRVYPRPILVHSMSPEEVKEMIKEGGTHGCDSYQVPQTIVTLLE